MIAALAFLSVVTAPQERPFPRPVLADEVVVRWDFDHGSDGWTAAHDVELDARDGALTLRSVGDDPYLRGPRCTASGELAVRIRARFDVGGGGQVFYRTERAPGEAEERSAHFAFVRGDDRVVECALGAVEGLTQLRLDPGSGPGTAEIDWIEVRRRTMHPLAIEGLRRDGARLVASVRNHGTVPRAVESGVAPAGGTVDVGWPVPGRDAFEDVALSLRSDGLAPLRHVAHVCDAGRGDALLTAGDAALRLAIAPDGRGARIERGGEAVAALFPIAMRDGATLSFERIEVDGARVRMDGDDVHVELEVRDGAIHVTLRADRALEGPVLRTLSAHDRAVFAGLEFLTAGEASSSDADVETDARFRFAPDPGLVTLPLMAAEVGGRVVALTWTGRASRPTFLAPNTLDGDAGTRMSLRGAAIDARALVLDGTLETAIDTVTRALPAIPAAPLPRDAWRALCRRALAGPLRGADGWGHCAEPSWPRQPYADHASAWFRLTSDVPDDALPGRRLVPGGAHWRDDTVYLVSGRADEWLRLRAGEAERLRADLRADGTFGYAGPYRRGHYEDTASGQCAPRAMTLLEHARLTGDARSLDAGLRALAALGRFRTPRGAQTWELSLHTPDIMAAAYAVEAHALAFELTGDERWLAGARTWALRGLPFIYLWSDDIAFATIAVYGATNWRAPVWFGLPVQWCGVVYAQALARLAGVDGDPRWRTVALGVLRRAQRMQYPDGPVAGCLPDVFHLDGQRAGPSINPCALLFLDATLAGDATGIATARSAGGQTVAAPFPVRIDADVAVVAAQSGLRYQVVVDGARTVDVTSVGEDRVQLR